LRDGFVALGCTRVELPRKLGVGALEGGQLGVGRRGLFFPAKPKLQAPWTFFGTRGLSISDMILPPNQ
jgi:hypothetical protein